MPIEKYVLDLHFNTVSNSLQNTYNLGKLKLYDSSFVTWRCTVVPNVYDNGLVPYREEYFLWVLSNVKR